jgi:hypothetical protein
MIESHSKRLLFSRDENTQCPIAHKFPPVRHLMCAAKPPPQKYLCKKDYRYARPNSKAEGVEIKPLFDHVFVTASPLFCRVV